MIQREGRIIRKGNMYENVFIFRYVCEGSFDAYSWQILENKQKFISQFLMGSAYQREAADLEENVLSFAEVKALALADPRMKELAKKENELANLRILNNKFIGAKRVMKEDIIKAKDYISKLNILILATKQNTAELANKTAEDYKELRKELAQILLPETIAEENTKIYEFWGYEIITPNVQRQDKPSLILRKSGAEYRIECGDSSAGNALRVTNQLEKLNVMIFTYQKRVEDKKLFIENTQRNYETENPYSEKLKSLERYVKNLKNTIETS